MPTLHQMNDKMKAMTVFELNEVLKKMIAEQNQRVDPLDNSFAGSVVKTEVKRKVKKIEDTMTMIFNIFK
jgi:hypothetical protein